MRKQKINFACWALICMSLIACSNESALEKSVFIPDPQNPGLPVYSDMGYNVFGAYYDRSTIVSNDYQVPVKVVNQAGVLTFTFTGQRDFHTSVFVIEFALSGINPQSFNDLISFDNSSFDLTSAASSVTIREGGVDYPVQILDGTLLFKKARSVKVDNQLTETTLSGTFEFHALVNQIPVTMSSGRFDVGVNTNNFYKY